MVIIKKVEKKYNIQEALTKIFGKEYADYAETTPLGDSFQNNALNVGYGTGSQVNSSRYVPNNQLTWDVNRIMQMERDQPLLRKCVEYTASGMLGSFDINSPYIENDKIRALQEGITALRQPLHDFIYQSRFYGGGACLLVFKGDLVDGNEEELLKPLDISKIKKGDFLGLKPLERWFGVTPTGVLVDSLGSDSGITDPFLLGEPLYFDVSFGGKNSKKWRVHRTRLLIYNTGRLPYIQKQIEQYWGVSIVEHLYEPLTRYNVAINAVINMFIISSLRVVYMDALSITDELTDRAIDSIKNKFKLMNAGLNFGNMLFLSNEDKVELQTNDLNGVADILKQIKIDFCACANIAPNFLFSDGLQNVEIAESAHKDIKDNQNYFMAKWYKTLIPVLYRSLYGEDCPEFSIYFHTVKENTSKENADIIEKVSSSLLEVYKSGVMDDETFIRSLNEIVSNTSDVFNNFNEDFIKSGKGKTYTDKQIEVARALNKGGDSVLREKQGGEHQEKKPTPRVEGASIT